MTDVLDLIPPGALLARPDLAEQALEGLVRAKAYRAVEPMHCRVAVADLWSDDDARIDQLLFGEAFDVLESRDGRAWGRSRRDGVVGWVVMDNLAAGAPLPTRRVVSVDAALPLNALVGADAAGVAEAALEPIGAFESDLAAVAERLLGRPHALGARSSVETDCSGLVQQALLACGQPGPRRSHDQAVLGESVEAAAARRGDIVVWLAPPGGDHNWTGHSALMVDAEHVVHSTGARGGVVVEPLAEVEARLVAEGFVSALFRRI